FERVFLLNSLLDLNCFRYQPMADSFPGCTTFAVTAEAGTGRALVGQTYDMPELHQDYATLLRLRPAGGPRQLVFTFAGIVGAAPTTAPPTGPPTPPPPGRPARASAPSCPTATPPAPPPAPWRRGWRGSRRSGRARSTARSPATRPCAARSSSAYPMALPSGR